MPILDGERILVVRVGGFGDLLWLAPIYQQLRDRGVHITHCAFPHYLPVLSGFVDATLPYPLRKDATETFDRIVWLENIIEGKAVEEGEHPHDRIAKRLGIEPCKCKADYDLTDEEHQWAAEEWPRTDNKNRICLQAWSSTGAKNYPNMGALMRLLHDAGMEILVVGSPQPQHAKPPATPETIYDSTFKRHDIRQSIAMAYQCDVICAPDSVFVHVGHALDIPVVGLFGPFHGRNYMLGYEGKAIQGNMQCSPCSWHPRGTPYPPDMPCARHRQCIALNRVTPEFVFTMIKRYL